MSKEVMQMALDALEELQGLCTDADDGCLEAITIYTPEAITALREALAAPQPAAPQRQPLTQAEVVEGFCKQPHDVQFVSVFNAGVRFAEAAHGIKEKS